MSKCNLDVNEVSQLLTSAMVQGFLDPDNAKNLLVQSVQGMIETYGKSEELKDAVKTAASSLNLINIGNGFSSEKEIDLLFLGADVTTSAEKVSTDPEFSKRARQVLKGFLIPAYGTANIVRLKAEKEAQVNLVKAMICGNNGVRTIVRTTEQLNRNLREYQQLLLNTVVEYLRICLSENPTALKELEDITMYKESQLSKGFIYTGSVEKVAHHTAQYLATSLHTSSILRELDSKQDTKSKMHLKAYNAWQMLTHFDSLLAANFKRALVFLNFGDCHFTGENKYSWSKKGANQTVIFGNDTIDLSVDLNDKIQLLISSTELRDYKTGQQLNESAYLTLSDVSSVIGKIKGIVTSSRSRVTFTLDEVTQNIPEQYKEKFKRAITKYGTVIQQGVNEFLEPDPSKNVCSLESIINNIRENPLEVLPIVFKLLLNPTIQSNINTIYGKSKGLSISDYNVIYSLHSLVLDPNSVESLNYAYLNENLSVKDRNALYNASENSNYFELMCQAFDSMFTINFMLYYEDNDGTLRIRNMRNGIINDEKGRIERAIKSVNSKQLDGKFTDFARKYQVYLHTDKTKKDSFGKASLKIPYTDSNGNQYTIKLYEINSQSFKTIVLDSNNKVIDSDSNNVDYYQILNPEKKAVLLQFISEVLGQLIDDATLDFINSVNSYTKNSSTAISQLLQLAVDVTYKRIVSNIAMGKIGEKNKKLIQTISKLYFGENAPYVDSNFREINLVDKKFTPILENLAYYNTIKNGLYNKAQIKNGEGNSESSDTLSRLISRVTQQWETQIIKNKKSSARNFSLVSNPGLFRGIQVSREIVTPTGSTSCSDFTVQEFAYSSFIHDFIGGLMSTSQYDKVVGSDLTESLIAFITSVNSDKNTISKLVVDVNKKLPVIDASGKLVLKSIRSMTANELKQVISKELGDNYTTTIKNILEDFDKLSTYFKFPKLGYINGFKEFDLWFLELGIKGSQVDFIKNRVREYNLANPKDQISLIDLVHFVNSGKKIVPNETLLSYYYRFNGSLLAEALGYPDAKGFWNVLNQEVLKSLIRSNFSIDLTKDSSEINYLKGELTSNYPGWIDSKTGKMILGKINGIPVTKLDLILDNSEVELNPFIEQHNLMDYLFTQEFMISCVGSCIAHPAKGQAASHLPENASFEERLEHRRAVLREEAARFLAQHKRNVSYTATMQEFQLNQLNGIPTDYNVAVIEDIRDIQENVMGDTGHLKPFDGATFCNPFIVHLENYSLGSANAGLTKKQFVHFYNELTGTGGIIKTAGFPITNDQLCNSPFYLTMMYKMTNRVWRKENGEVADDLDITKDNTIISGDNSIDFSNCFFKNGTKNYRITSIEKGADSIYTINTIEVNEFGNDMPNGERLFKREIKTNYQLWQALGGMDSLEIGTNGKLIPSENSIIKTTEIINRVGYRKTNGAIKTLDDFYQPLKYSDVHYVATEGAVKLGAANINPVSVYSDNVDSDTDLLVNDMNFMKVHMNQAGIQLDKEHAADHAHLSLMTQVISACAHNGFSAARANKLYEALRTLTDNGTKALLKPFTEYFKVVSATNSEENINMLALELQESVLNVVISKLSTLDLNLGDLLTALSTELLEKARKGERLSFVKDLNGNIPLDNAAIHAKFISQLSVFLTNSGIRITVPGILSVLTPSYDIIKLYGTKKFEQIREDARKAGFVDKNTGKVDTTGYLQDLQQKLPPIFSNNGISQLYKIRDYRWYQCRDTEGNLLLPIFILGALDYNNFKLAIQNGQYSEVKEYVINGRNLAAYNTTFNASNQSGFELTYLLHDLDSHLTLFLYKYVIDHKQAPDFVPGTLVYLGKAIKYTKNLDDPDVQSDGDTIIINLAKLFDLFNTLQWKTDIRESELAHLYEFNSVGQYLQYRVIKELATQWNTEVNNDSQNKASLDALNIVANNGLIGPLLNYIKSTLPTVRKWVLNDLIQISKTGKNFAETTPIFIGGEAVIVDKNYVVEEPYELVLPKTFIRQFGLEQFDQLSDIADDPDFFFKRMQNTLGKKILDNGTYDVELKKLNGEHIYLLDAKNLDYKLRTSDAFVEQPVEIVEEDGHYYTINGEGEHDIEVSSKNDKIFLVNAPDALHRRQVIVTNNINFFAESCSYTMCRISTTSDFDVTFKSLIGDPNNISNPALLSYYDLISSSPHSERKAINSILGKETGKKEPTDNLAEANIFNYLPVVGKLKQVSAEMHASFLKSLEVIGARIPAQSMQSFMAMKIVAFDNPNINTAYVNTSQIWYLGSDY